MNMLVFGHRRDDEYLAMLRRCLSIDGPDGLLAKAVPISSPFFQDGREYSRCCRIDFVGIAATTLFDTANDFSPRNASDCMAQLFANAHILNANGIFVKLRFLLAYPFSAHAFARIQAEVTQNRSSMEEPVHQRNFSLVEHVDENTFVQSHVVLSQTQMLNQLQEWIERYKWSNATINRVMVRFAPILSSNCMLFVNDALFTDSYLFAKRKRAQRQCELLGPLVKIDRGEDHDSFSAFDDHFRYLWDLDLTLYCEDATEYVPGRPRTLGHVKAPHRATFDVKATKIKEKTPAISDEDLLKWKFRVRRLLGRYCMEPSPTQGSETLFITCSWESEAGQAAPIRYAQELMGILDEDFGRKREQPILSVFVMDAVAGGFFTQQLYSRLQESTLAVVLLTADIEGAGGKWYSKPNVYHELGYLMRHLGESRVLILREDGVTIPSNVLDDIRVDFSREKLVLRYGKIAGWIIRTCRLGGNIVEEITRRHVRRLQEGALAEKIATAEFKKAEERLKNDLVNPNPS